MGKSTRLTEKRLADKQKVPQIILRDFFAVTADRAPLDEGSLFKQTFISVRQYT